MRAREFTMKDGYSFHMDQESLDATYREMHDCYSRILRRMDLRFRAVEADTGNIGGASSHEFHVLADSGEDVIVHALHSDYAANLEKATAAAPPTRPAPTAALTRVATPGQESIAEVSAFLSLPAARCLKTLILDGVDGPVAVVLRGDHALNEIKAQKLPGVTVPLRLAADTAVLEAAGCRPGSLGPLGLAIPTWVDIEAAAVADFVCGANTDGFHYTGANWERDIPLDATRVVDVRNVLPGDPAPDGSGPLALQRGIEVGHIFQLGRVYSAPLAAGVLGGGLGVCAASRPATPGIGAPGGLGRSRGRRHGHRHGQPSGSRSDQPSRHRDPRHAARRLRGDSTAPSSTS
jgi:prolyl-tRNA synthetase